ncbi:MAG: hypothetical protein JNM84_19420 [Planctomycetes bacterium]|nr:hypothetical protein [Planctomycetota bacterium]
MSPSRLHGFVSCLVLASVSNAQSWRPETPAAVPPPRAAHAMATDVGRGRILMFGGAAGSSYLGDTWEYDGSTWSALTGPAPAARARHAMAFDAQRATAVLFGGIRGVGFNDWFGDTWEHRAGAWQQRASAHHPPVRFGHAMAGDPVRGRVVMFGGRTRSGTVFLADTWEWDGVDWIPRTPAHAPSARMGHAMAFDPSSGRVLLFGGLPLGGPAAGDTWAWDGNDWTVLAPQHAPAPRMQAVMATDERRGRVVLYGGSNGAPLTDTAEWNGSDWAPSVLTSHPELPTLPALATGPTGRHVLLFGGEDVNGVARAETWTYGSVAAVRSFGAGCGSPPLALHSANGRPVLGQALVLELAPVPVGAPSFVWLGISSATWLGIPLPLDLTTFGATSCSLYQDAAVALPCTPVGSIGSLSTVIPNLTIFANLELFAQGFALAPGVNLAGAITSQGLALNLGFE